MLILSSGLFVLSYGKALPGQSFRVFDSNIQPLPPGVKGMMYIGGIGLAKGYFNDKLKLMLLLLLDTGERYW